MNFYCKSRYILLIVIILLGGAGAALIISQAAKAQGNRSFFQGQAEGDIDILESSQQTMLLEYKTPGFQVQSENMDGENCQVLQVKGYGATTQAGWPQLPVRGYLIGIPNSALPLIEIVSQDVEIIPGSFNLCPVGKPKLVDPFTEEIRYPGMEFIRDPEGYSVNRFFPGHLVELGDIGEMRSQRVAQLRFQPFQFNPVSGELRYAKIIRVRINFDTEIGSEISARQPLVDEGSFEQVLSSSLLNYQTAQVWRTVPQSINYLPDLSPQNADLAYKIFIEQDGIYQINRSDLINAGVPVDQIDPNTIKIHNQGEQVALYIAGEEDDTFNENDYLLLYGEKKESKFTNTNVYWLTWGGADGKRMPIVDGNPAGITFTPTHYKTNLHLEEDHYYQSSRSSGVKNDHWYWDILQTSVTAQKEYTFSLENLSTHPVSATLSGLFYSYSASPQHHTRVRVNEKEVLQSYWAPGGQYSFTQDFPQSYLQEGVNTITLEGIGNSQIFFINWFDVDYYHSYTADSDAFFFDGEGVGDQKFEVGGFTDPDIDQEDVLFDITDPILVTRIISAQVQLNASGYQLSFAQNIQKERHYAAISPANRLSPTGILEDTPSNLHEPGNGADYIIITHQDFYTDVMPLAEQRLSQGLRVQVVKFQDIVDEFNDGIFDPEAMRNFLSYAYSNWTAPAPAYVLLVGDGNFDFKNNLGRGEPNYIPPYLVDVDPWMGETASDNRYVSLNGPYDILPDMYIGRLPVKTPAEAQSIVKKILDYELNPSTGDWTRQVLFVADNVDNDGDFPALSDAVADHYLPPPYQASKIYYGENYTNIGETQSAILNAINGGNLMVSYIGHASPEFWSFEFLLHKDSIETFTNFNKLSFFVPMTCLEGYFIHPSPPGSNFSSLGEMVVRAPGKGALASWSPTGLGVAVGHDILEKSLFEAIFFNDIAQLGPATTLAKYDLYANGLAYRELIDTYLLFGDPYTALHVFVIDTSITGTPPNPSKSADAGFTFSSNLTEATFECKLDGGEYQSCTSPVSYLGLSDGQHTFHVRAVNTVGNPDSTPASFTWMINTGTTQPIITFWPLIYK